MTAIKMHLARAFPRSPPGLPSPFLRPPFPVSELREDSPSFSKTGPAAAPSSCAKNTQAFMAEASKRPELTGVMTTALFGVPQVGVNVDKAKVLTQQVNLSRCVPDPAGFHGRRPGELLQPFGRQWQVWVQADGKFRTNAGQSGQVLRDEHIRASMVPLSTLTSTDSRSGPEFVMRYNQFQCVQINGAAAPGLQLRPGHGGVGRCLQEDHANADGLRLDRHVVPGAESRARRQPEHHLRPVVPGRVPDHGRAIRQLDAALFSVLAGRADRGLWSLCRSVLPQARQRCVCADWAGDADRAVGQERHSDRGIRQDGIRQRRNRCSMRLWLAPGCDCGPS